MMPTQVDTSTSTRFVLNPSLIYIADRQVGPTRGGCTLTITRDMVQPEMDGVNQMLVGMSYKRSDVATLEFAAVEFSPPLLNLMNNNVATTGSAPNFIFTPFANQTMMASGQYMPSPGLKLYGQLTDVATPGYFFFFMPNGMVTVSPEFGATGEATLRVTITSAVPASTPDAVPYTYGRVAALPTEVAGP